MRWHSAAGKVTACEVESNGALLLTANKPVSCGIISCIENGFTLLFCIEDHWCNTAVAAETGMSVLDESVSDSSEFKVYTLFNITFLKESHVMLCEELSVQHICGLSTANEGTKWVPDDGSCDVEASLTRMNPGPKNQHVMTFSWMEMCLSRDVSDWRADVFDIGRTSLTDAANDNNRHSIDCQLMKHVTRN